MKSATLKKPNIIISRLKENFEGVLSIFDGNKYTIRDILVPLTGLLKTSTQFLNSRAQVYSTTGNIPELSDTEEMTNTQTIKNNNSKSVEPIQPNYSQISREENRTQTVDKNKNERSNC